MMTNMNSMTAKLQATRNQVATKFADMQVGGTVKIGRREFTIIARSATKLFGDQLGLEGKRGALKWFRVTDCGLGFVCGSLNGRSVRVLTPAEVS